MSDFTEAELQALRVWTRSATKVLELGSGLGVSTIVLAERRTGLVGGAPRVVTIDWHRGDVHTGRRDSLPAYLERVYNIANIVSIVGRFEDAVPALRAGYFEAAFIDGCHEYVCVQQDIHLCQRVLAPEGALILHDYGRYEVKDGCLAVGLPDPDELVDTLALFRTP